MHYYFFIKRPPYFPSPQYFLTDESKDSVLIPREKYVELFEQGFLKKNVICRDLIEIKANKTPILKDFNMSTPNPDHEELLEKVKEMEIDHKVSCFNNGEELKISKSSGKKFFKEFSGTDLWNEGMDIEEEKNNIQSLCENKFRMKSFLDEKFEQNGLKGLN